MIATGTSSLVAYFNGHSGADVDRLTAAFAASDLVLPPVVVSELLSDPASGPTIEELIRQVPALEPHADYWLRAGVSRRRLIEQGLKARLGER
jgi:predicted nucleic acid-binding protein